MDDVDDEVPKPLCGQCDRIMSCIKKLKSQRSELIGLIKQQETEKENLRVQIEQFKYKIHSISKSLATKLETRERYDKAIRDAECVYEKIVAMSTDLVDKVCTNASELSFANDKKIGTDVKPKTRRKA